MSLIRHIKVILIISQIVHICCLTFWVCSSRPTLRFRFLVVEWTYLFTVSYLNVIARKATNTAKIRSERIKLGFLSGLCHFRNGFAAAKVLNESISLSTQYWCSFSSSEEKNSTFCRFISSGVNVDFPSASILKPLGMFDLNFTNANKIDLF